MEEYLSLLKDLKMLYDKALEEDWDFVGKHIDLSVIKKEDTPLALARAMDELMPALRAGLPVKQISSEYLEGLISTARCSTCGSVHDYALCTECGRILCPSCCDSCFLKEGGCSLQK